MKNLYDMVVEAVAALNDGFSAFNVTQWVRQMANVAQQNNEDLDLPPSSDPAFKWEVSHADVKQHMEQLYRLRVVDRSFNSSGYFVYHVVATAPAAATSQSVPATAPVALNPTVARTAPALCDTVLLLKLTHYIDGYRLRNGYTPSAKEVQSRLKRDCNMTCLELLDFAQRNSIPVVINATASVSTIG